MSTLGVRGVARWATGVALLAVMFLWGVQPAGARPTYFDTWTSFYGIGENDRLHACGVCHFRWDGTGARNLYGTTVEFEIYNGTPIAQAIINVEGQDPDGDGFTSVDEIVNFETLPGYNCGNFFDAIGEPPDIHTYTTPMVATCLDPLDIRVVPTESAVITPVGETIVIPITVFNNGSDFALDISSYGMLAGSDPTLSVAGPAAPLSIPVGGSVVLDVTFSPVTTNIALATLRISSNDPDQPDFDVALSGLSFIQPEAPPEDRAACLKDIDKHARGYTKKHFREWTRCYAREVTGRACDGGKRDQIIQQAEARLRAFVGGAQDQSCAGNGLSPTLLKFPDFCGGGCGQIELDSIDKIADCLICRQDEGTNALLASSLGTTPPDLPSNVLVGGAASCQKRILGTMRRGTEKIQRALGGCELDNVTAAMPVDCAVDEAAMLQSNQDRINAGIDRCSDTTGMLGCLFPEDPMEIPDPSCMGDAALSIGSDLVDATFGLEE